MTENSVLFTVMKLSRNWEVLQGSMGQEVCEDDTLLSSKENGMATLQ